MLYLFHGKLESFIQSLNREGSEFSNDFGQMLKIMTDKSYILTRRAESIDLPIIMALVMLHIPKDAIGISKRSRICINNTRKIHILILLPMHSIISCNQYIFMNADNIYVLRRMKLKKIWDRIAVIEQRSTDRTFLGKC